MILLWGSNARETHPIFFHHLLKGIRNGAELYVVDPRRTSSARWANLWLGLDVGSDISLANAMGREIIAAGLANEEFIRRATSGLEAYKKHVEKYTLERAERETAGRLNAALADAKEAAERATRAETRAAEIERRADDLNAELGRVHEQNTALIAAIAKRAADNTDKGKA